MIPLRLEWQNKSQLIRAYVTCPKITPYMTLQTAGKKSGLFKFSGAVLLWCVSLHLSPLSLQKCFWQVESLQKTLCRDEHRWKKISKCLNITSSWGSMLTVEHHPRVTESSGTLYLQLMVMLVYATKYLTSQNYKGNRTGRAFCHQKYATILFANQCVQCWQWCILSLTVMTC